jgi:hypothetical protein
MRAILVIFLCLNLFGSFRLFAQEKITIENLTLFIRPTEFPKSIPMGFVPEGSKLLYSTDLKKFGFESVEIALIFESPMSKEELLLYYEVFLKGLDWRILQKETNSEKSIFLAESPGKKNILTILLTQKGTGSFIKLFSKKQTNY